MAEKTEKRAEAAPPPAPAAPPAPKMAPAGGMLTKTPILLGGVMLIEAVVLFAGFKFLGGSPQTASAHLATTTESEDARGSGHGSTAAPDQKRSVELKVVEFKAPNKQSGRTFLYDVAIYAVTKGASAETVKQAIADREALIKDRVRTIMAQSDPEKLGGGSEPGLETLRRQVKYQLDEIIGEGMIDEVLVPRCIPFRTDY